MDKTKLTYKVARKIYDSYRFLVADFKIKNLKKVTNTKKKIVFISQMSNLWINVDDLYNQLSNDDQFETYVLMIPEFDYSKKEFDIQTMNTKIYDFHKNHNHQNTIKAFDQGKWFDLKNINPDYVFYERPYSSYLPMEYKISTVSKYAKTCYLPYGYEMMNYIFDTSLNVDFFRYLHIFFADSYVTESFNKKRAPLSHRLGLRKTILTGHPIFNAFNKAQSEDNLFWDNDDQHFKIIWAPRWTIDTQLGGSNFLTYKDNIVDYVEKADASKTTVVISANKPYDVQMYPNADAIMAVYGSKGDPTEQLIGGATGSTTASGPNITAGVEVAFGVFGASGKLPVSIPKYVLTTTAAGEVGSFSDEILYDNGYGITYDAKVIDRDTLANKVAELEKLEKGNYTDASWSVFEIALKNAQEVLSKVSSQDDLDEALATLNKAYEALTENKKEEPTNPSDKKDESTNKKDETVKTETKKNTQKSKVKTGDNTAITAFAVMMFISGCVFVLARRKRND